MSATGVAKTKGAAQVTLAQSLNPDKMVWDGANIPIEQADAWFEAHAESWAERSGQSLHSTRGVLARWLYFFATFLGYGDEIRSRFGRHTLA